MKKKLVILLSRARSGSTLLRACLNRHPDIVALSELFYPETSPDFMLGYYPYQLSKVQADRRLIIPDPGNLELLNAYFDSIYHAIDLKDLIIIDLKYSQGDAVSFLWFFISIHQIPVVHLTRSNVLHTHISEVIMNERFSRRDELHSFEKLPPIKVHLDVENILSDLRQRKYEQTYYRKLVQHEKVLSLTYEDMYEERSGRTFLSNETEVALCEFLQVQRYAMSTDLKKQTDRDIRNVVTNYDAVCDVLSGTEFEAMIEIPHRQD